jgi:peroxiredoxin-like protein
MNTEHYYQVKVSWLSDRKGLMQSDILNDTVEVATPPEFPKGIAGLWSPEHLFVAAINSCFMTTFLAVAENSKLSFTAFTSNAVGKLEQVSGKYMMSEVILKPVLTITDPEQKERAERILQKSESSCLISNSVNSKIILQPTIIIAETEKA